MTSVSLPMLQVASPKLHPPIWHKVTSSGRAQSCMADTRPSCATKLILKRRKLWTFKVTELPLLAPVVVGGQMY
eukprot:scaffold212000_cov15-Tisochrysis_lutea.AAC.1